MHSVLPGGGDAGTLRHADIAHHRVRHVHAALLHPDAAQLLRADPQGHGRGRDGRRLLACGRDPAHAASAVVSRADRRRPVHVPAGVERVPLRRRAH